LLFQIELVPRYASSLLILSRAFTITTHHVSREDQEVPAGAGDVGWADQTDELAAAERQSAAMREIQDTLANLPEVRGGGESCLWL
jgi:hypothetical protein